MDGYHPLVFSWPTTVSVLPEKNWLMMRLTSVCQFERV